MIPRIADYEIPASPAENRVTWQLDRARSALLVHDLQEYFLDFYAPGSRLVARLLDNVQQLILAARAAGVPVVYTAQPAEQSPAARGLLTDMWGPGITRCPEGTSIHAAVRPAPEDLVLPKARYSAFQRTGLLDQLRSWGRDQLVVTGVYAHIGCYVTSSEAFMNDIAPFFVSDGVADFSRAEHETALDWVARTCGRVITAESALGSWQ